MPLGDSLGLLLGDSLGLLLGEELGSSDGATLGFSDGIGAIVGGTNIGWPLGGMTIGGIPTPPPGIVPPIAIVGAPPIG